MYIIYDFTDNSNHLLKSIHQVKNNGMMYFELAFSRSMITLFDRLY